MKSTRKDNSLVFLIFYASETSPKEYKIIAIYSVCFKINAFCVTSNGGQKICKA